MCLTGLQSFPALVCDVLYRWSHKIVTSVLLGRREVKRGQGEVKRGQERLKKALIFITDPGAALYNAAPGLEIDSEDLQKSETPPCTV